MTIQQTSFCSFKLKFKNSEVSINPTGKTKEGIVVFSENNNAHLKYEVEESVKLRIDAAGEYEADDIFVAGLKVKGKDTVVYTVSGENITVGIISFVNEIDSLPVEFFEKCDIVLLNAGGGALFTPKQAENVYQKLTPKICILFGFKEQAGKDRVDLFSIEELKTDVEGTKPLEKVLKTTDDELERISDTEVYYFTE